MLNMKLWDVTSVEEAIAVQNELRSKISLECQKPIACKYAADIVCDFIVDEGHIPQPTRLADIETHRVRKSEEQKLDL